MVVKLWSLVIRQLFKIKIANVIDMGMCICYIWLRLILFSFEHPMYFDFLLYLLFAIDLSFVISSMLFHLPLYPIFDCVITPPTMTEMVDSTEIGK